MVEQLGDQFLVEQTKEDKLARAKVLKKNVIDASTYELDDSFKETKDPTALSVHTTRELISLLEKDKTIEIDARVLAIKGGKLQHVQLDKPKFLESYHRNNKNLKGFRESSDSFLLDQDTSSGLIGDDFVSLLGGPFNKQLYIYDYLKMHGLCFYAQNHDPIIRAYVNLMRDFTLGRGFRVDFHHKNEKKALMAKALWEAFDEVNDLHEQFDYVARETCTYGEIMQWWLPNNQSKIEWQLRPGQESARVPIPRVRLIDPSAIWEIVTYPEDISRVLYYQWVAPTQYQTYTGMDKGSQVSSTKFIFQQIPADQVLHFKINCVNNEKRGRSDFFPVLGYAKRLRDAVNYKVVGELKNAAWQMDTEVQGNQDDLNSYIASMEALGPIPPAGSEFVHTNKIKRQYLAMANGKAGASQTFEWCFSMIAAGLGVPTSYFGTHLSGGQTRASAIVATEPVAKKFQQRQLMYERMLKRMWKKLISTMNLSELSDVDMEITFPTIIEQDSAKQIETIVMAQTSGYISKERAANMVAKELDISEFDFMQESIDIEREGSVAPEQVNPLTTPSTTPQPPEPTTAVTSQMRKGISDTYGF